MLVYDQVSDFSLLHRPSTLCQVRVFDRGPQAPVVVLTEIAENTGMSVTNASEYLATELRRRFPLLRKAEPIWVEHYNGESYTRGVHAPDRFGTISFSRKGEEYHSPNWRPLSASELQEMLGEPLEELGFQPAPSPELQTV